MSIDATSWSWDFGDGSPASTTQNPAHTYAANGDYNVSLVATNSYGSNTAIKNNYITVRSFVPGLNATYYYGQNWLSPAGYRTDNEIRFADADAVSIGEVTDEVNWPNSMTGRQDDFSVEWDGYLRVTTADTYTFSLRSDDGSWLWVDEGLLIDNSGLHSPRTYTGTITLTPGYHHIVMRMFENTGQAVALLQYSSPSMPLQQVTDVWHTPVP
jgi:PKD repeat protein